MRSPPAPQAWRSESPGDARPYLMLGALALARGEIDAARILFREALERDPDNPEARRVLDRIEELKRR